MQEAAKLRGRAGNQARNPKIRVGAQPTGSAIKGDGLFAHRLHVLSCLLILIADPPYEALLTASTPIIITTGTQ
jgi:hypothetical protein